MAFLKTRAPVVTPLSFGHDVVYKRADGDDDGGDDGQHRKERPLAVLSGWMGARQHQLDKYASHYRSKGWDTVAFAAGLQSKKVEKRREEKTGRNDVTLFDRHTAIGGQFNMAKKIPK